MNCSMPASRASSTAYWMSGRSTTGSISFGMDLVAGRNRVPRPPMGNTALRIFRIFPPFAGHWVPPQKQYSDFGTHDPTFQPGPVCPFTLDNSDETRPDPKSLMRNPYAVFGLKKTNYTMYTASIITSSTTYNI